MNENWSLHLTLLNNRTGQKIGANYPKNKYEILEMLDRCQIPYGSGDYAHLAVPFPDGTPDSLQLKLAGVIENEHCPPSIRQVNFLAEQLQRMSAESREALMQELKALLLARPTSIQGATKLATRLSCYEFFRYAELQDLLQEHKLHMDCRTLADHLNFDETNYGFIRYRLGHNLDVELDTIRLMENAKTEDAFWNATKYLFGRNSPDSFQRWIAFVDRQVESNQYADNFPSAFPPNPAFTAQFWLGSLLAAFYQVAEQYGDEIAFKIWSCPHCYPPHQLLALAEHLKEGGMIEGAAQKDFGPDGLPLPFPMLADVLPADSPYWEEDPAAAVERIRQEQIAQNRAQLRTDLASGTRQLWDLEQELQGRAGTFPGWLQGAYEVNEDFEQSLGEVIAELCETFQEIRRRYGIEIARELYNEHPVILSSELPGAAQFLSLGGSCGGAAELAGVGFFMPEEDITEAEMARAAAYMNAGGNASEVYKAIEQNG